MSSLVQKYGPEPQVNTCVRVRVCVCEFINDVGPNFLLVCCMTQNPTSVQPQVQPVQPQVQPVQPQVPISNAAQPVGDRTSVRDTDVGVMRAINRHCVSFVSLLTLISVMGSNTIRARQ